MIIDEYLAFYDFNEYHKITVKETSEQAYPLMLSTDIRRSFLIKALFRLRGMPTGTVF